MKKIYSLLLLGGLLFFGVQSVWATLPTKMYIKNMYQTSGGYWWDGDGAEVRVYFATDGHANNATAVGSLIMGKKGTATAVYEITLPTGHDWTLMKVQRGVAGSTTWNETLEISGAGLPTTTNDYLVKYYAGSYEGLLWNTWNSTTTDWKVWGAFDSWNTGVAFVKPSASSNYGFATITISTAGTYEFQFRDNVINYMNCNHTFTAADCLGKEFSTSENTTAKITVSEAGNYLFVLDFSTNKLYVMYPHSRSLATGKWGTICLPVDATITGANLYTIAGKDGATIYLAQEATNDLVAGKAYIFKATEDAQSFTYKKTSLATSPLSKDVAPANGLAGQYTRCSFEGWGVTNICVVRDYDIIHATTKSGVEAYRAYIDLYWVPDYSTDAPARPIVAMPVVDNNATDINAIEASEKAVKYIQNGKLYILRDGVTYDAIGRIVK